MIFDIMTLIRGRKLVDEACASLGVSLADLIALSSVWVSPDVFAILRPVAGTWYPARRRANLGLRSEGKQVEFVGQVIDGVTLDSNNYANVAFKQAIGVDRLAFIGFHVCHIWSGTAYDARYFTNVANLAGIPAELASLTDYHPHIIECLKFRSFELYGWKPDEAEEPQRPDEYPDRWRAPVPATDAAVRAARRRAGGTRPPEIAPGDGPLGYHSAREASDAAMLVAFYLSKFDHERLRLGNQGQTFDAIAARLGMKRNTLKNYRDYFDSHTGSRREGWKVELPDGLRSVFERLKKMSEEELRAQVLLLLGR